MKRHQPGHEPQNPDVRGDVRGKNGLFWQSDSAAKAIQTQRQPTATRTHGKAFSGIHGALPLPDRVQRMAGRSGAPAVAVSESF